MTEVVDEVDGAKQGGHLMSGTGPNRRLWVGYMVFGALVSIKIAEYVIATRVRVGDWPYLAALALASAWLIIYYYKHIRQLWHLEDKENG